MAEGIKKYLEGGEEDEGRRMRNLVTVDAVTELLEHNTKPLAYSTDHRRRCPEPQPPPPPSSRSVAMQALKLLMMARLLSNPSSLQAPILPIPTARPTLHSLLCSRSPLSSWVRSSWRARSIRRRELSWSLLRIERVYDVSFSFLYSFFNFIPHI